MAYFVSLLFFSFLSFQRGNTRIWTSTVKGADFEGSNVTHTHEKYAVENTGFVPPYPQYPPTGMVIATPSPELAQPTQPTPGVAQV